MAIDRERILVAAQKYVEKKRYDRAAIEYQKILQEDPSDARILLKLGDLQSKMEAYADAVATYDRVGKYYASQGFALKAIAVFKQIREIIVRYVPALDEKYSHITPKLAELYQQLGLTSDALAALDEVATRLQRQNRDPEAIDVFRRIVELDPTNPLPHLRLAEAYSRVKDVDAAILEFGTASGQLLKLGRRDDALKVIDRILAHKPDPAHARIAAELYLQRGSVPDGMQALAKLQLCFQANPRDLDTLALLARAFTQIGQAGKAIEVQKEMARIARDTNRQDLFRELVAKLVKLAPNDEGVRELAAAANGAPAPTAAAQAGATNALAAQTGHAPTRQAAAVPAAPSSQKAVSSRGQSEEEDEEAYEDVGDSDFETEEASSNDLALHAAQQAAPRPDPRATRAERAEPAQESANVSKTLGEAAAYRRAKRHDDALRVLRNGLRAAPRSLELHEMFRDVLLDGGHTAEAVAQMIQVAELLVEALDGEGAARSLQDALALEPDNAIAARMLHDLGYELVEEGAPLSVAADEPDTGFETRARQSSYNPDAPLPSYDLEEIGPEHVAVRSYGEGSERALAAAQPVALDAGMDAIDDPFADGPLPSFPLDPHEAATSTGGQVVPERGSHRRASSGTPRGIPELESALEEADFFASRGLFDDARTILEEQLARLPNHPLIRDRLAELEMQERSAGVGSGTRPSPAAESSEDVAARDDSHTSEVLGSIELGAPPSAGRGPSSGDQVDVEEVFAKFKAGVAAQIGEGDAQSHYDLGVAYKEMALLDDAMREFDVAARDPKHECICHSMIGMIQIERGNLNEAINSYQRGLAAKERTKDQEAALCYELGAAYEAKKLAKQALEYFTRVARLAPSFRDVQERIRRLQKPEQKAQPARAVGADDEFDRAFNDILGEDKRS